MNASKTEPVHFLQIWLLPKRRGLAPSYEQRSFDLAGAPGRFHLVASEDGRDGSLTIHTDASIHAGRFDAGQSAELSLAHGRSAWVQVARGAVEIDGRALEAGDGASISDQHEIAIRGVAGGEVLVFDLA
jgi:redox-sensitive bicupin YhaK (pirin superfamily)